MAVFAVLVQRCFTKLGLGGLSMQNFTPETNFADKQQAALKRLERFSLFTDSSVKIPFTKFTLGADALLGLLPVVGDMAGLLLSSYVLIEAQRLGVSWTIKLRILANMLIDFVGGLLPIVGDIFDAYFKANTRNTRLLEKYLAQQAR
jgi:hypothetical protein